MAIGTGMAIALGLGAMGGQTAANIYGSRRAGQTNDRALAATERSDTRAAEIAREDAARLERLETQRLAQEKALADANREESRADREAKMQRDRERWADYLRINEPFWKAGSGVAGSLFDIAGYGQSSAPAFSMPQGGPPVAGGGELPPIVANGLPSSRGPRSGGGLPLPPGVFTAQAPTRAQRPMPMVAAPQAPKAMGLSDLMMLMASTGGGVSPGNGVPLYSGSVA